MFSEKATPINKERRVRPTERIRQCADKLHCLTAERRDKQNHTVQQLVELDTEVKYLISENQTLKCRLSEVRSEISHATGSPGKADAGELQKHLKQTTQLLSKTKEELNKTRQRLAEVQERLTVAEQVTAATQQRALQESGNSDELQLELTPQHQSTTHTGDVLIS